MCTPLASLSQRFFDSISDTSQYALWTVLSMTETCVDSTAMTQQEDKTKQPRRNVRQGLSSLCGLKLCRDWKERSISFFVSPIASLLRLEKVYKRSRKSFPWWLHFLSIFLSFSRNKFVKSRRWNERRRRRWRELKKIFQQVESHKLSESSVIQQFCGVFLFHSSFRFIDLFIDRCSSILSWFRFENNELRLSSINCFYYTWRWHEKCASLQLSCAFSI